MKSSTLYYLDDDGKWWFRIFPPRCCYKMFGGECQGVKGHTGDHWCYRPSGDYAHRINTTRKLKKYEPVGGWTPPGHPQYVNPVDKSKDHLLILPDPWQVVTNKRILNRLERRELLDNESLTEPCD